MLNMCDGHEASVQPWHGSGNGEGKLSVRNWWFGDHGGYYMFEQLGAWQTQQGSEESISQHFISSHSCQVCKNGVLELK